MCTEDASCNLFKDFFFILVFAVKESLCVHRSRVPVCNNEESINPTYYMIEISGERL